MDYLAVVKAFVDLYLPWLEIHKVFRPTVTDFEIFRKEAAMKYCPFLYNLSKYYSSMYIHTMHTRLNLKVLKFESYHRFKKFLRKELGMRQKHFDKYRNSLCIPLVNVHFIDFKQKC